jgi:hypothetical protein
MSWLYSRALVEEYLGASCLDGEPCALSSGTHTQPASWLPDKTTDACRLSRSGMTYKPLTESRGEELLTLFRAVFPVKIYQLQEREQESTESEAECGATWPASLAKYDPDSRSWKTAQCLLFEDSAECLETFPRWGMMRSGELWERTMSAHLIKEAESGLWPTPNARDWKGKPGPNANQRDSSLPTAVGEDVKTVGKLNPTWVEWLMGWPLGWTDLKPLETDKFQQWLHSHGRH